MMTLLKRYGWINSQDDTPVCYKTFAELHIIYVCFHLIYFWYFERIQKGNRMLSKLCMAPQEKRWINEQALIKTQT